MIKPDEILNFQDFLDYDEFFNLQDQKRKMSWQFNGRASSSMKEWHLNNPVYGGVKNPITDYTMLPELLRPPLIKLTNKYNVLIRPYDIYYNAYKFGNEMEIHTDKTTKPGFNRTIILYLTDEWSPEWHGETVLYDDKKENIRKAIVPYPNSLLVFDSRIPHSSVPISKFCTENRIILVYQCEIEPLDV